VRAATGVLGAALAAGGTVFAMRNGSTRRVFVTRITAAFSATVAFTAASQQLFVVERFTAATPTGGTAYTPMPHGSHGASQIADARASTTAALTTAAVVFAGAQIPILGAASPAVSTNVAGGLDLSDDPITLGFDEGLCIRNAVVWPVAGTGSLTAVVSWFESN